MTLDSPFDEPLTDEAEFEALLGNLLLAALQSDINPAGAWVYRENGAELDLEVQVVELAQGDDD
jgi:hypothetical protein